MLRLPHVGVVMAACAAILPLAAQAQSGGVPAYEPPPPVSVQRDGEVVAPRAAPAGGEAFRQRADLVANFTSAYQRNGRPRLALYWNRQLSDTLSEWYSDVRVVGRSDTTNNISGNLNLKGGLSGDAALNQTGSSESTLEVQRRIHDAQRAQPSESFEWEFQDGYLAPFLEAGASVLDRTAIIRLTGADMVGSSASTVEVRALQGKADYLMEILGAPNGQSSVGYELRARILEVSTGRIVAYVNSRGLKEWNPEKEIVATSRGFQLPDEDDETFGPVGEDRFKATGSGFERRRKPPKLQKIAQNLAYNVMESLMRQWK